MVALEKLRDLINYKFNPLKEIEVFGMFGPGNLGDEAMLVAAYKVLSKRRCVPWQNYPSRPMINSIVLRKNKKHLLVGGGTLIHGGDSGWLDYVEMRSRNGNQVSFFGTGVAFSPAEISEQSEAFRRWRNVLSKSEHVYLRGPCSVDICENMGVKAGVFGDFAFLLYEKKIPKQESEECSNIIGINVGEFSGDQEEFLKCFVLLIKKLAKHFRFRFHVVSAADMKMTCRLIAMCNMHRNLWEIKENYFDPYHFMQTIRDYRAFIGLKLHAAGLAMIAGVPTLMIAYLPKCLDFMAPLGESDHMIVRLPLNGNEIISRIEDVIDAPEKYVILDKIALIAESQEKMLTQVFA